MYRQKTKKTIKIKSLELNTTPLPCPPYRQIIRQVFYVAVEPDIVSQEPPYPLPVRGRVGLCDVDTWLHVLALHWVRQGSRKGKTCLTR